MTVAELLDDPNQGWYRVRTPKLAMDCQMTVVELLDDPDPGIQTKVGIGYEPQVGHGLSDDCSRTVR